MGANASRKVGGGIKKLHTEATLPVLKDLQVCSLIYVGGVFKFILFDVA